MRYAIAKRRDLCDSKMSAAVFMGVSGLELRVWPFVISGIDLHPRLADYFPDQQDRFAFVPLELGRDAIEPVAVVPGKSVFDLRADRVIQDHCRLHVFRDSAPAGT